MTTTPVGTSDPAAAAAPAPPAQVPAWKLLLTLGGGGAVAGLLLVVAHQWTQPRITAHKARVLADAVREVLHGPARYDTLYVHEGALSLEPPKGVPADDLERVYLGYDADDRPVGFAIAAAQPGFQDVVRLIIGYDPHEHRVLGMKVLDNKETPGLGDRIEKDPAFAGQFAGRLAPIVGVKKGAGTGDPHEIDMITGATISSRAVLRIIDDAVLHFGPALERYTPPTVKR